MLFRSPGDFADGMNNDDDFDMFRAGYLDKFRGDPQQENMPPAYQMGFQAGRKMDKGAGRRMKKKKGGKNPEPNAGLVYEDERREEMIRNQQRREDEEREAERQEAQRREAQRIQREQEEAIAQWEADQALHQMMQYGEPEPLPELLPEDEEMMDMMGWGRPMKFGFLQRRPSRHN